MKIIIVGRKRFDEFVARVLEAIDTWRVIIMAQIDEIKTALAGVKTGISDITASIVNISTDQKALLDRITDLEEALASGTVVSPEDLAQLKQQAMDLKTQTDQLTQFSKGVADAVPDEPPATP